jgi:hypothetical protein
MSGICSAHQDHDPDCLRCKAELEADECLRTLHVAERVQKAVDVCWVPGRGWPQAEPGLAAGERSASFMVFSEFSSKVPKRRYIVTVTEVDEP